MVTATTQPAAAERLGPAERIVQTLLTAVDHIQHDRPGVVSIDRTSPLGVRWAHATHSVSEDGTKTVYRLDRDSKKTVKAHVGVLRPDGQIENEGHVVARYQPPGLFAEAAAWMYRQVSEVWKLDNEFAARWASYAWAQEHRDLKVVLCAFMLCQSRCGTPVTERGKLLFHDANYRDVGRAMILLTSKDKRHLDAKLVLRVRKVLRLSEVAAINRELGFGRSARVPYTGAWESAAHAWLRQREANPGLIAGLVKAGFTGTVVEIARRAHYRPAGPQFFATLRWHQEQRADGRFTIGLDQEIAKVATWEGLDETAICERIVRERPNWKVVVGMLPPAIGVTRAIMTAAIEAGSLSDKDLICATPTLEELGLLEVQPVRESWQAALRRAEDQRSRNIAKNVTTAAVRQELEAAADVSIQKQVAEVVRGLRIWVFVDRSGSMANSIEQAKRCLMRFVGAFPLDRLHVWTFNTVAMEITIQHPSSAGVEAAFRGVTAGGGTDHTVGIRSAMAKRIALGPAAENEDNLFFWIGDEGQRGEFSQAVRASGLNPVAFGLLRVPGENYHAVTNTASALGIPLFMLDQVVFEGSDPYAVARTLRNAIAAAPAAQTAGIWTPPKRETLVDTILKTELLKPPAWV